MGAVPLEFASRIARLPRYPAADRYGAQEELVLLASNESPFPPLAEVQEAVAGALPTLNRYPDPTNHRLRAKLAERYDLAVERIAIGNGSCDILLAAGEALLEPGAEVVYGWPSFSVYPHLAAASGARAIEVALDGDDRYDLERIVEEVTVATRLVLICNPNNPTSTAWPAERIAQALERIPEHVCVVVDEAYCEFNLLDGGEGALGLLAAHPNLVLLRTFSKAYSLCGLRVGYALCSSPRLVEALNQVRQPFFCNALAQRAAEAVLDHGDRIAERVAATIAEREEMAASLAARGLRVADSQANFCWLELPAADHRDPERLERELVERLLDRGVVVRAGTALGEAGHLRVTYGTAEQNRRFLEALDESLAELLNHR